MSVSEPFDHDDGVVGILEEGDPEATGQVGGDPTNMASSLSLIQDGGKRVHHHIEQERGEGIALSNPTEGGEVRADLPIDVHGSATARDHLHYSGDPTVVKALPEQNFLKEGPTNNVISLMKIDL